MRNREEMANVSTASPLTAILSRAEESGTVVVHSVLACHPTRTSRMSAATATQDGAARATVTIEVTPLAPQATDQSMLLEFKARIGPGSLDVQLESCCRLRFGQDTLVGSFPTPTKKSAARNLTLCLVVRLDSAMHTQ
jgi:hypothetical protein